MKKTISKIVRMTQEQLAIHCIKALKSMDRRVIIGDGFVYSAGSLPVMIVAHLDTVHKETPKKVIHIKHKNIMYSPQGIGGDDRCGVYILLRLAQELDCHVLFCEDEEIGAIGAQAFCKSNIKPDINYILEFDRKGDNDAVYYDCDNQDFIDFIDKFGFVESYGSFSDITYLAPHLGVAAVNLSSGFYNAHTKQEYIKLDDIYNTLQRAREIIESDTDGVFEYVESKRYSGSLHSGLWRNYGLYDTYDDSYNGLYADDYCNYKNNKINIEPCDYCQQSYIYEDLLNYHGALLCADCFNLFTEIDKNDKKWCEKLVI